MSDDTPLEKLVRHFANRFLEATERHQAMPAEFQPGQFDPRDPTHLMQVGLVYLEAIAGHLAWVCSTGNHILDAMHQNAEFVKKMHDAHEDDADDWKKDA